MKLSIKINREHRRMLAVFACAFLTFGGFWFYWRHIRKQPVVCATIFMHGTVGSTFNILNPFHCLSDSATDETYSVRTIKKYRNHVAMKYDQILGDLGLTEFNVHQSDPGHAECHLITAYDDVAAFADFNKDINKYATFGWSGLLSQQARKEAAVKLYDALCVYRQEIKGNHGVDPIFRIVAHSHGGNVALLLAEIEKEKQQNIKIDLLFMLGTPMQTETAPLIKSHMFKTILLAYSHGDSVQTSDYFSTQKRQSHMRMSELVDLRGFVHRNPGYARVDMQFIVNDDETRITHTNMWLVARSIPILDFMDPLPLFVLLPLYAASVKECDKCVHYKAHLDGSIGTCSTCLVSCTASVGPILDTKQCELEKRKQQEKDLDLYTLVFKWRNKLLAEWQSDDTSRHIIFNYKNVKAIADSLF